MATINSFGESRTAKIRPSSVTVLIFATVSLLISAPGIYAVWHGQWQGLVFIGGGAIVTAPLFRYLIAWDENVLVYRGLIKTQKIQFSDVKKIDVSGPTPDNRYGPTLGLRIFSKSSGKVVMIINLKPFSRRDVGRLVGRLKHESK